MLDGLNIHGQITMNRLLMAQDFKLSIAVPLTQTTLVKKKREKKKGPDPNEKNKFVQKKKEPEMDKIETRFGTI
jgi:hypothetical protein